MSPSGENAMVMNLLRAFRSSKVCFWWLRGSNFRALEDPGSVIMGRDYQYKSKQWSLAAKARTDDVNVMSFSRYTLNRILFVCVLIFGKLDITAYDRCENLVGNEVLCFFGGGLGGVEIARSSRTPLKSNIDTQNCHVWKEMHFPNHHFGIFWVSILILWFTKLNGELEDLEDIVLWSSWCQVSIPKYLLNNVSVYVYI